MATITSSYQKNNETIRTISDPNIPNTKLEKLLSTSFDKVLFSKELTALIHCPTTAKGSYTIPCTVTSIGIEAFAQCKELTSVLIPASVKSIGCLAFHNCISLTSITIPCSINEFGYRVFSNCNGLKTIFIRTIQPVILKADSEIFHHVDKLTCILYVPEGSKRNYQRAEVWKEFENVQEVIDFRSNEALNYELNYELEVSNRTR